MRKEREHHEEQKSLCYNFLWSCSCNEHCFRNYYISNRYSIVFGYIGTVLSAAILGPVPGLIVGALSNIITGLIYSVSDIPFCLVNMAVGLIVGLVAKKWKFGIVPAIITGLALSFICPAIGTPIGIYVYGGLNGTVSDMLVMSLVQGGKSIFQASFLRNVASNLIDKVGTCVIGCLLIKAMPMKFLDNFKKEA